MNSAYANAERFTQEKIINGKTSIQNHTEKLIKQLELESTDTIQLGTQLKDQLKLLKRDNKL